MFSGAQYGSIKFYIPETTVCIILENSLVGAVFWLLHRFPAFQTVGLCVAIVTFFLPTDSLLPASISKSGRQRWRSVQKVHETETYPLSLSTSTNRTRQEHIKSSDRTAVYTKLSVTGECSFFAAGAETFFIH